MPTARPSIIARVEVLGERSNTPARAVMPVTPTATPIRAVSSGRPAAINEPNVTISTTAAIMMPMISPLPGPASASRASPPTSTVSPASRPFCAACDSVSRVDSCSALAASR